MYGWPSARAFLYNFDFKDEDRINLTDGKIWPWWLFLGNTGNIRQILEGGVVNFHVANIKEWEDMRAFLVTKKDGVVCVHSGSHWGDKMRVCEYAA